MEFARKYIKLQNNIIIKVTIWDTSGQERYNSINNLYYKGADGVLLIYDTSDEPTFNSCEKWVINFRNICEKNALIMVLGNKVDEPNKQVD